MFDGQKFLVYNKTNMKTKVMKASIRALVVFGKIIRRGEIAAFPTETVYGLGGDATNSFAVEKIFKAKGRPSDNPLIVHLGSKFRIKKYVETISPLEREIIKKFMPGPISLVLKKNELISSLVTAGGNTVAIRIPECKLARRLINFSRRPICAPSANTSKRPSPTVAAHVLEDLNGKILLIVDGGQTEVGIESTVVKVQDGKLYILRPGKISKEDLEKKLNVEVVEKAGGAVVESPGVKYAHYMPKCRMVLAGENDFEKVKNFYNSAVSSGKSVVIFCKNSDLEKFKGLNCVGLGEDSVDASHNLFKALRDYEENDLIIALKITNGTMAAGLYNRMSKAARGEEI